MLAKLRNQGQKKHNKTARNAVYGIGIVSIIPKIYYMKKLISLSFCAITLIIIGCSKDGDDDNGGNSQKMELITSAAWKYDTAVVEIFGSAQPLPPGLLQDCDRDNLITLKDDGTGTVDEGGSKCDVADPQSFNITWQFKENESVINIPDTLYGSISGDAEIEELTASKLRLRKPVEVENPLGAGTIIVDAIISLKH